MKPMREQPYRRYNPLSGEWVLVSPQRVTRPWQGKEEARRKQVTPAHDPQCYLCPGNKRAGGARNPAYTGPFVFTNDFPALLPDSAGIQGYERGLLQSTSVSGTCRVVCFSPRHDLTLAEMDADAIRAVIDCWVEQTSALGRTYRWVQVFENKGEIMGCSNPHPHGQIWALDALPSEAEKEDRNQRAYWEQAKHVLLLDYLEQELESRERVVAENEAWVVLVPYWAIWPFETLVVPRRHVLRLPDLVEKQRDLLARILKELLMRYDALFDVSFPYSMGWHAAPFTKESNDHWQLHAHFYPPLLRSASVKKFMVGFEMLAEAQRDLTAEVAAGRLREMDVSC